MVACICHSPLHRQTPDFEGQSVIKASSYLLPFVLEAHRESLPRSCETSARRLSAESVEVYSTADLSASAAHIPFSLATSTWMFSRSYIIRQLLACRVPVNDIGGFYKRKNDSGSYVVYHKQNALSYKHFQFKKIERSNKL